MVRQKYKKPPVDEVVCSVQFAPLDAWKIAHIGSFWELVRGEFPKPEHAPPLDVIGTDNNDSVTGLPLPRVWLVSEDDTQLIQLQRNRFIYNWRKRPSGGAYIGYESVQDVFIRNLVRFRDFFRERRIGDIVPRQLELAYIDVVPQGEGWEEHKDIGRILPILDGLKGSSFGLQVATLDFNKIYSAPVVGGSLHLRLSQGTRIADSKPVFRIEFRAFGVDEGGTSIDAVPAWFDRAHDQITSMFAAVTSDFARNELWQGT
jgi:uncharacterized protein (TIGR04255 family)